VGRRSERLNGTGVVKAGGEEGDFIQVVARAFDLLRCFGSADERLGNQELARRSGLPRSTISRLTHTLTRIGQLIYLPDDQKYRLGNAALAMSCTMLRGLEFRAMVRARMQELAEDVLGTIGLTIPDRVHMVYLEYARAARSVGLQSTVGSRVSLALTAAGRAHAAALDPAARQALLRDLERHAPDEAGKLKAALPPVVRALRRNGYVISCGDWNEHINGIAVPMWSPRHQTYLVFVIGVLAPMYDRERLRREVAPRLLAMCEDIRRSAAGFADGDLFGPDPVRCTDTAASAPLEPEQEMGGNR
jgi:DNA-binding IclR family transcriptional regulator